MNNKLIAALVCMGMTGAVSAAQVDFNNVIDVSEVIEQASSVETPQASKAVSTRQPGQWDGHNFNHYPGPSPHHVRYSRDCHRFHFGPAYGPVMSEIVSLESVEYVQECHYVPDPPPNPGPHPQPGPQPNPGPHPQPGPQPNPGPHPQPPHHPGPKALDSETTKGMQCHEVPADVFRRTVQLHMGQRELLPWEDEAFDVCMEGPRVDLSTRKAAYSYNIKELGNFDVRYELTPLFKVTQAPDRDGLSAGEFSYADGRFAFKVSDRWAKEYAGEKVAIKVELYKDGFLIFNSFKGDKEFTFDAAANYQMVFAESELNTSKVVNAPEDNVRGAKKYYLKWGFRRLGSISTNEFVKKDATGKIEVR